MNRSGRKGGQASRENIMNRGRGRVGVVIGIGGGRAD